ncbi:MAG: hypothetical protein AB8B56_02765 [Crocinitomicaceae bacterium]
MNSIFHKAKHWQLFVILVGGFIIFQALMMVYFVGSMSEDVLMNRPPQMSRFFLFFVPMMIFMLAIIFGWQWSIGSGLKHLLPRRVRMNFKLYRAFTIVPIAVWILYMIYLVMVFTKMEQMVVAPNPIEAIATVFSMMLGFIIFLPLMLFATFCMFYNFYYCAKTLKSIELGYEAELNDYIGYFFLFWFNFIGFWIIQPSVNRITSGEWTPPTPPPGYEPLDDPNPVLDPIQPKEAYPKGELLKTNDHEAFEHDDDFDGLF